MEAKKKILMIDDDVDFAQMTKLILEKTGLYDVVVCNESTKALEQARGEKPDLILLDVMMPKMDGGDIAAKFRQDRAVYFIPLVFMTSLMTAQEAARSPLIANHQFISKPISGEDLIKRIQEIFELENRS